MKPEGCRPDPSKLPPATILAAMPQSFALIIVHLVFSTKDRTPILTAPNRPDDDRYILRLIGQVITVSLETQQIIATLPSLDFPLAAEIS
jgi:hypothetical protein